MKRMFIAGMLVSGFALAQPVQKWVDEKGRVHYGTPPPGAVKQQTMTGGTFSSGSGTWSKSRQAAKPPPATQAAGKDGDTRHPLRKGKER